MLHYLEEEKIMNVIKLITVFWFTLIVLCMYIYACSTLLRIKLA